MLLALFIALIHIVGTKAADWTVTYYVELSISIGGGTIFSSSTYQVLTYASTYTSVASSGITPSITPTDIVVTTASYPDVGIVEQTLLYVPFGAIAYDDAVEVNSEACGTTTWVSPLVYKAATSCINQFSFTVWSSVTVPYGVGTQLRPVSTTINSALTAFLSVNALPSMATSPPKKYYDEFSALCNQPAVDIFYDGNSDDNEDTDAIDDSYDVLWKKRVIAIATILPSLFVLGFFESYYWLHRLMTGRGCLRCGTVCWILISLWVLCFTRVQGGRPEPDQAVLRQMWKETPWRQRLRLWRKWGFRHKYPDVLQVPALADAQQMQHLDHKGVPQKETTAVYREQLLEEAPPAYSQAQQVAAHPEQAANRTSDAGFASGPRW